MYRIILPLICLLTGCADRPYPASLNKANPASVHCLKLGGKLEFVDNGLGSTGYCILPGEGRVEEWRKYLSDELVPDGE
ncbi:DUF333 domain-containing protein [Erwinia persicina]|uniref:DUF333 domain-containing protein n=1 Tax=Erwinia persicina TaxID=55211 RepID=A0A4U3EMD5_9GAMM|nr:DUF333 domain-containing protein [Erwinia persicina]MBD8109433.1 DUF333 domain-containing protein [Erwinia persicina]MBD8170256.1 DUF333 domain-containing protein [Erwinia persicina]MBD8212575.1 DUF333 domain-containing protein [Erwinia persicina]TKJ80619.1 DUF333 domain-containing protein [Erwinia persicina]